MKAIDFVVRTSAGSSQVSTIPADKNVYVIDAGANFMLLMQELIRKSH
jgi:hypothetical protein